MHPKSLERRIIIPLNSAPIEGSGGKRRGHCQVRFEISNVFQGMFPLNWPSEGRESFQYARFSTNLLFAVTDDSSRFGAFMRQRVEQMPDLGEVRETILRTKEQISRAHKKNQNIYYGIAGGRALYWKANDLRKVIAHANQASPRKAALEQDLARTNGALHALVQGNPEFVTEAQFKEMEQTIRTAAHVLQPVCGEYFTKTLGFTQAPVDGEELIATHIFINQIKLFELETNEESVDMGRSMPVIRDVRSFQRTFPLRLLQRALLRHDVDDPWYVGGDLFVFAPRADPSQPLSPENVDAVLVGSRNPRNSWSLVLTKEVLIEILLADDALRESDDGVLGGVFAFLCDWNPHPSHARIPESGVPSAEPIADGASEPDDGNGEADEDEENDGSTAEMEGSGEENP